MATFATKYRPHKFEDVCGQSITVDILKNQIENDTIPSAMGFFGNSGCVDMNTEYFNGCQWKPIHSYTEGEKVLQYNNDGTASLVTPVEYIKLPCDEFVHFKPKYGFDMCLSPEHRIIYESKQHNLMETTCFELMQKYYNDTNPNAPQFKLRTTFNYGGSGISLTDDEIRLMCAIICDGTFKYDSNHNIVCGRCRMHLKKDSKKTRLIDLLNRCGIDYTMHQSSENGYDDITFTPPMVTKTFDYNWYNCNNTQLEVICDEILYWDGNGINRFSNTNKDVIDFVQFAFTSIGKRATIREYNRVGKTHSKSDYSYKSIEYDVMIANNNVVGFPKYRKDVVVEPSVDGYKYCFVVDSGMWIMRRNGRIIITGNCGKTTIARIVANMLNEGKGHPIEIDAASNNSVENVRTIIESASQRSLDSKYKIYIIDECHSLSNNAWQAFLKLLEEPNKFTKFIFCTTNPEKIPDTVISRLQTFSFTKLSDEEIVNRLKYISTCEGITIDDESLRFIAKVSNGSVRQSITNLEKCCSNTNNPSYNNVVDTIGSCDYTLMSDLFISLISKDTYKSISLVEKVYSSGKDLKQFIFEFLKFMLDLSKANLFNNDLSITGLPNISEISNLFQYNTYFVPILNNIVEFYENNKLSSDIRFLFESKIIIWSKA